ncbi:MULTISPECIES: MFS transporter [unclassified Actinopolyspora]|uniref:MFS transporter n=1 Tax=unclassified Actinopolyspora TaxID=2639451 RepID=UPI0013F5A0CB|nr:MULTISPECIES: MFS transporter [unclassified Actinopolyspora]NHD17714.1 MFS transporter [Actinopolyspora sp. BKK2]NHE76553.1 MFS transporter [Actinopolyspora sp. BKK1]
MRRTGLPALWFSNGVVSTAGAAGFVAIPWFVLEATGSAARVGVVTAAELVGLLLAAALSGPVIDRIGPARIAPACDVAAALCLSAIPVAHAGTGLTLWSLTLLTGAFGALREPGQTARRVALPRVVDATGSTVERGAGGMDAAFRAGQLAGAPLAGSALALFDSSGVLWFSAAALLLAALAVLYALWGLPAVDGGERAGLRHEFAAGFGYLRRDRLITWVVVLLAVTNLLDASFMAVFLPTYAARALHSPVALGVLSGTLGGAALVGNLLFTWLGTRVRRRRALFVLAFALGPVPPHVAMALGAGFPALFGVIAVGGLAAGVINPILATASYERIPVELRGRVLSLTTLVAQMGTPLGVLLGGFAAEGAGLRGTLVCTSLSYAAVLLLPLLGSSWKELDRPEPNEHEVGVTAERRAGAAS